MLNDYIEDFGKDIMQEKTEAAIAMMEACYMIVKEDFAEEGKEVDNLDGWFKRIRTRI